LSSTLMPGSLRRWNTAGTSRPSSVFQAQDIN
jgi:hypothetical protein